MNRLTWLVNQPESILRITPLIRRLNLTPATRSQSATAPLGVLPYTSCRKFSFVLTAGRSPEMETNPPENLSGSVIDDFVRVDNPVEEEVENPNYVHVEQTSHDIGEGNSSELPDELSRSVMFLSSENSEGHTCKIYLVGTAHVSEESCREVQAVINCLKPQVVFLELCSSRLSILTIRDLKVPTMREMIAMWKRKENFFGIIYSWFLAKVASKLDVLPGSEFRVAFEEALKCGSKVILGDRPVNVTLRRTWRKMSLWHKIKLIYCLLFQAVFLPDPEDLNRMLKEIDDVDMLTLLIQEMSKEFPSLMETLVNERDQYMSAALLRIASEHTSVVAVVGKGHLQGIKRNWKQPIEINELLEVPLGSSVLSAVKVLMSVSVAVVGTAIVSSIYFASKKQS